jgi:hypothetical protein
LGATREDSAISSLAQQLSWESDPEARYWSIVALGQIGGENAKNTLLAFTRQRGHDLDPLTRLALSEAMTLAEQNQDPQ